jgi:hypothetical protein
MAAPSTPAPAVADGMERVKSSPVAGVAFPPPAGGMETATRSSSFSERRRSSYMTEEVRAMVCPPTPTELKVRRASEDISTYFQGEVQSQIAPSAPMPWATKEVVTLPKTE